MRPLDPSDLPSLRTFIVRRFKSGTKGEIEELVIEAHSMQVTDRVLLAFVGYIDINPQTGETVIVTQLRWIFNAETWVDVQEVVMKPSFLAH
jgi:hypothetical protein